MQFDRIFVALLVTNAEKMEVEMEKTFHFDFKEGFFHERTLFPVSFPEGVVHRQALHIDHGRQEDVDGEALATLVVRNRGDEK
ncbi:MAG: hypothetical protein R2822_14970 [Spirosomataceae bacterium]